MLLRCITLWFVPLLLGFLLWNYETEPSDFDVMGGFNVFMSVFFFMPLSVLSLSASYDAFLKYKNRHKPTISINPNGLRCPFLLNDRIEIPWNNILNIQYVKERAGNQYFLQIFIEVANHQYLGKLPSVLKSEQKNYPNQMIIIRDIYVAKGYELEELATILQDWWIKYR